jgi:hypothetical protein
MHINESLRAGWITVIFIHGESGIDVEEAEVI